MGLRVVLEALRRRWKAKVVGLLTVAFGIAVLGALLHLVTQGEDRLALDLRGYGPNLVVTPAEGALLASSDLSAIKTIFWRNNVTALAPELPVTVDSGTARFVLVGSWLDHAMDVTDAPAWRTGMIHLEPSWLADGAITGDIPQEDSPAMLVGARLAAANGWKVGDIVPIARGERSERLTVAGILHSGDAWEDKALAPIAQVQHLLGREGELSDVLVSVLAKPDDKLSRRGLAGLSDADKERMTCSPYLATVADQISKAMPGAHAEPLRRVSEAESGFRSRLQSLLALLAVSSAVLTCLGVYGSVRGALMERRSEMELMQALGARRSTIAALFLGEGLAIGAVGALIGSGLGFLLANALSRVVFGEPMAFGLVTLPLLMAAGLVLSGAGAGLAIRQALRADTVSLLRSAT